jgi:hypothetical protein
MGNVAIAERLHQLEEPSLLDREVARHAQAQVVDETTVDQMDVRSSRAIEIRAGFVKTDDACRRGRIDLRSDPRQRHRTTGASEVVDSDRAKERWQRRGRGDRTPDRHAAQVRAEQVELRLRERKPRTGRQGGSVDHHVRPHAAARQVAVRCAVEQFPIEVFGEKLPARESWLGEPRQIGEDLRADLALHVALQESGLEIAEQAFPMDRVVGGDDAAAGHRVDDVDLVEQPSGPAPDPELHVPQRFHRSVRQRGRARASARQGQDDQHVAGIIGIGLDPLEPVALGEILGGDRRVGRALGVATDQHDRAGEDPREASGGEHCVEQKAHGSEPLGSETIAEGI